MVTHEPSLYRIYYDASGLPGWEIGLSPDEINHHMDYLPIELHMKLCRFDVKYDIALRPGYLWVSMSAGDTVDLDSLLSAAVQNINIQTPGLCFLIERVSCSAAA